jgi:hypothetical protein
MFGPKHTFESVAKEIANGLEEGTITLHPEEPTEADIENFESMAEASIARYQRIEIGLSIFTGLLLTTAIILPVILPPKNQPLDTSRYSSLMEIAFGFFAGSMTTFLFAVTTRKRSIELKTFIQILKLVDTTTARRLVLWERARLHRRRWFPQYGPTFP